MKRMCIRRALVIASIAGIAGAQTPDASGVPGTAELLKTVDQLIELNRQLVQNQQLTDQIKALRQAMTAGVQSAPGAVPQKRVAAPLVAKENAPLAPNRSKVRNLLK